MNNTESLKKNKEFLRLYKKGNFYVGKIMVIYVLSNKEEKNKLGVSTVKNFGSSVLRNRMRRLVKENYRHLENEIEKGWDIVFSIRKINDNNVPSYKDVEREMKYLFKKTGLLK